MVFEFPRYCLLVVLQIMCENVAAKFAVNLQQMQNVAVESLKDCEMWQIQLDICIQQLRYYFFSTQKGSPI